MQLQCYSYLHNQLYMYMDRKPQTRNHRQFHAIFSTAQGFCSLLLMHSYKLQCCIHVLIYIGQSYYLCSLWMHLLKQHSAIISLAFTLTHSTILNFWKVGGWGGGSQGVPSSLETVRYAIVASTLIFIFILVAFSIPREHIP